MDAMITLVNTKFDDLMGELFSGLFLCADHKNQSHFASSRQDFILNLLEISTIFTKIPELQAESELNIAGTMNII